MAARCWRRCGAEATVMQATPATWRLLLAGGLGADAARLLTSSAAGKRCRRSWRLSCVARGRSDVEHVRADGDDDLVDAPSGRDHRG